MELKSLFLGLVLTIGVFAIKSGIGLYYFLIQRRKLISKPIFLSLYGLVYLLIFVLSSHILKKINIIHYFEIVQGFLESGMFIHILMAGGLIIWGIVLLKRENRPGKGSFAWLALIIPCPVCIMVIFFSAAFLLSCFPDSGYPVVLGAYLLFMAIVITTLISMKLWSIRSSLASESTLGAAMLIIAVYFFLSVIIMPQFSDLSKIYRLAAYHSGAESINARDILLLYSVMATLFSAGFWAMRRKIRRRQGWI